MKLTSSVADDGEPSFSPDGTEIAFQEPIDGGVEVLVVDLHGSDHGVLTSTPWFDGDPAWSPVP